jgi:AraC-like DNA-binding protein
MTLAVEYLRLTGKDALTTAEIAKRLGYRGRSQFSRAFRKYFNQNPSEFRYRRGGRRQATGKRRRRSRRP